MLNLCWSEFVAEIRKTFPDCGESRLRNLLREGKISKPALDGSLRARFTEQQIIDANFELASRDAKRLVQNGATS